MRALTIRQPYASLVAVGAKTIETRSRPTSYRGPLLIHAGLTRPPMMWLPPLSRGRGPEAREHDRQTWHVIDTITAPEHQRPHVTDPDHPMRDHVPKWAKSPTLFFPSAGPFARPGRPDGVPATEFGSAMVLPLGAVVASCRLIDCVPIGTPEPIPPGARRGVETFDNGTLLLWRDGTGYDVSAQGPFGDFSPGRYAWLLDDVSPTTERCPRCWDRPPTAAPGVCVDIDGGWWHTPGSCSHCASACPVCVGGTKRVAPVPMRGRQGLWTPNDDDWEETRADRRSS